MPENKRFCEKCKRVLKLERFYQCYDLEKNPDGYLNTCKDCLTMHVDNFDPKTFTWILQEIDVPYIPDEWNQLLARYGRDKSKLTGTTILGRYLAKMKLKQFKDFHWKDNDFLRELNNSKIKETMERQGYSAQEIAETIQKSTFSIPDGNVEIPIYDDYMEVNNPSGTANGRAGPVFSDPIRAPDIEGASVDFAGGGPVLPDFSAAVQPGALFNDEEDDDLDLSEDDIKFLRLKWGRVYRPSEWVQLEQLYNEMTTSYDIQSAGDINTLKLMCKTSLKANQLLDLGDVDGAQKMSKVYNEMMRSGKWTAAQNKTSETEVVDSIGELVAMCEKDGFIPRFYVDGPQDKVDRVIQDMQIFTRQLVTDELGLGNLIENSIKNLEKEKESIEAAANAGENNETAEEDKLFDYNNTEELLSLDDYREFNDMEDDWEDEAHKVYEAQESEE